MKFNLQNEFELVLFVKIWDLDEMKRFLSDIEEICSSIRRIFFSFNNKATE
jgi:hypothetical protein